MHSSTPSIARPTVVVTGTGDRLIEVFCRPCLEVFGFDRFQGEGVENALGGTGYASVLVRHYARHTFSGAAVSWPAPARRRDRNRPQYVSLCCLRAERCYVRIDSASVNGRTVASANCSAANRITS